MNVGFLVETPLPYSMLLAVLTLKNTILVNIFSLKLHDEHVLTPSPFK